MVCENAALTPYLLYIDKLLAAPCHTGQFTCCRLRHIVDGQTIACDKTQVSGALEEIASHDFQRCRDAIYLLQRHTSLYLTTAQIIHGSYFNIAPVDIVERLFDIWLLTTSLLFLCIVISRSEHGMRLTALNALRAFSCPVCACVRSMGMYHAHTMRMPVCRLRH